MNSAIHTRLAAAGYTYLGQENKGRYCHGMVTLCTDLAAMRFLREEHLLRVFFNAKVRKGHAFTYSELKPMTGTKSAESANHLYEQARWLAGRQILLRGYSLHCPICDLDVWYDLASVGEFTTCQGCRSAMQLPLEAAFSFRLNQLFIEGMKQGAATVLLTALRLYEASPDAFSWQAGVRAKKRGRETEIDLMALCGERLIVAECKDNFEDDAALHDQLRRTSEVAQAIGAEDFIFASLRDVDLGTIQALRGIEPITRWSRDMLLRHDPLHA
jgi:hypothetical protein